MGIKLMSVPSIGRQLSRKMQEEEGRVGDSRLSWLPLYIHSHLA
jgi:hypothetical protein